MSPRMCRSTAEVIVVWTVSIAIISPYMYHLTIIQDTICYDIWDPKTKFIYFTVVQTISCFLAVFIMIIVYSLSAIRLFRHAAIPGDNKVGTKRRIRQNQRVTRMFGGIVFIFFTLTTPYAISFFVVAYYGTYALEVYFEHEKLFFYMNQLLYAVAALNCCVNPFIYAKMHRNMKRTLWQKITLSVKTSRKSMRCDSNNNGHLRSRKRNTTLCSTLSNGHTQVNVLSKSFSVSLSPISSQLPSPCPSQTSSPRMRHQETPYII